ncbi:MAG TPA: ABC transporter substrate-binding protein, partial [Stellaceae bacterium]|jgi:NitT/TauT family transport system substrate-binding protein
MKPRIIVLVALVIAFATPSWADPVKIRMGWVLTPPELPPVFFAKPGIAKHLGVTYTYEPTHFNSSSPIVTALASGDIDLSPLTVFTLAAAIQNAKIEDLRILADEFQDGVGDYFSQTFMVRKDSGINRIEDLKGKVFGSIGIGSIGDVAVRVLLHKHGLEDKRDYSVIEAPSASLVPMLQAKKIDMLAAQGLFFFDPGLQEIAKPLFTQKDAFGPTETSVFVGRKPFLTANHAAVVDFFEDMLRAVRWYTDPANRNEAIKIIADFSKLPPERFSGWIFTKQEQYRDPNGIPDLVSLQRVFGVEKDAGLLKRDLVAGDYADLSYIKEAATRLQ